MVVVTIDECRGASGNRHGSGGFTAGYPGFHRYDGYVSSSGIQVNKCKSERRKTIQRRKDKRAPDGVAASAGSTVLQGALDLGAPVRRRAVAGRPGGFGRALSNQNVELTRDSGTVHNTSLKSANGR